MMKNQRYKPYIHAPHGAAGAMTVAALNYVTEDRNDKLAHALMVVRTNQFVYAKQAPKGLPKLSYVCKI